MDLLGSPGDVLDRAPVLLRGPRQDQRPRRPRIRLRFFDPAGGQVRPEEEPAEVSSRLLAEIRELVPPSISYRKRQR